MTDYLLGIEISGSQLKIAAFRKYGKKYDLFSLSRILLSETPSQMGDKLKDWVKNNISGPANIDAVVTIPESGIFLKEIDVPNLSVKQLREALQWEVASVSPIPLDEAVYEYKTTQKSKNGQKALIYLTKNQNVADIYETFEQAGINLLAIEPSSVSFPRIINDDFTKTTLFVTVEEQETNLMVLINSLPVFTTSVSSKLEGAKDNKRRLDSKVSEDLAANSMKIIEYWEEKNDRKIEQVTITGDITKKYYGLAKEINKFAKIPVLLAKWKKNKYVESKKIQNESLFNRFFIPIGAALRVLDKKEDINLFPTEKKTQLLERLKNESLTRKLNAFTSANLLLSILILWQG